MRSKLLAATALVAASAMPAFDANAEEPISLKVSGNLYGFYSVVSQDDGVGPDNVAGTADDAPGTNRRNNGMNRRGRIKFSGSTTLDNGLKVGVDIRLQAMDCTDQIDRGFAYFESQYGRVEFGKVGGVGDRQFIGVPNPVPHLGLNSPDIMVVNQTNVLGSNANLAATPYTIIDNGSKLERINVFTPRFYGFQLGASYTPVRCDGGNAGGNPCGGSYSGQLSETAFRGYDGLEVAGNYVNNFGGVDVGVYGAYLQWDNAKNVSRGATGTRTGKPIQYGGGAQIGYAGFALGGGYMKTEDTGFTAGLDEEDYNIGITYTTGPWEGGVMYAYKEATLGTRKDEFQGVATGGSYRLGPGISLVLGLQYYDWTTDSTNPAIKNAATNKAYSASFGTSIDF